MELAYLWPSFNNGFSLYDLLTPAQLQLSQQTIKYWGAFVATGRPEVPGQPAWPKYSGGQLMSLRPGAHPPGRTGQSGRNAKVPFWTLAVFLRARLGR